MTGFTSSGSTSSGSRLLYCSTADSSLVSGVAVPTLFNVSYSIPANTLHTGDVLELLASGEFVSAFDTDFASFELYIGGSLVSTGAISANIAGTPFANVDGCQLVVTNAGASAVLRTIGLNPAVQHQSFKPVSVDTTQAIAVQAKVSFTSNNVGNSARLRMFSVKLWPAG